MWNVALYQVCSKQFSNWFGLSLFSGYYVSLRLCILNEYFYCTAVTLKLDTLHIYFGTNKHFTDSESLLVMSSIYSFNEQSERFSSKNVYI